MRGLYLGESSSRHLHIPIGGVDGSSLRPGPDRVQHASPHFMETLGKYPGPSCAVVLNGSRRRGFFPLAGGRTSDTPALRLTKPVCVILNFRPVKSRGSTAVRRRYAIYRRRQDGFSALVSGRRLVCLVSKDSGLLQRERGIGHG